MIDEFECPNLSYRTSIYDRRYAPAGYENYKSYKPWLRDEFWFRCVYCLSRERWYPNGSAGFSIDHSIPQSHDKSLVTTYTNLTYACLWCNSAKSDTQLSNPLADPLGNHLAILKDGFVEPLTEYGQLLEAHLFLNEQKRVACRLTGFELEDLLNSYPNDRTVAKMYLNWFGFPEDVPDLRQCRPKNNLCKDSLQFSILVGCDLVGARFLSSFIGRLE